MDNKLILDENSPELMHLFMGDVVYQAFDLKWYEELEYDGNNKYRFLNIINNEDNQFLSETSNEAFFKYVNAIQTDRYKMSKDGFAILNIANYKGIQWKNITEKLNPKICIFWGVNPAFFGLESQKYKILKRHDMSYLYVDDMDNLFKYDALKKQLWNNTKGLFDMV